MLQVSLTLSSELPRSPSKKRKINSLQLPDRKCLLAHLEFPVFSQREDPRGYHMVLCSGHGNTDCWAMVFIVVLANVVLRGWNNKHCRQSIQIVYVDANVDICVLVFLCPASFPVSW